MSALGTSKFGSGRDLLDGTLRILRQRAVPAALDYGFVI